MSEQQYKFRNRWRTTGLTAQAVGEFLETLRKTHGGDLSPADVVEAARDKKSPVHSYFEWDDSIAAEKWRIEQARQLIIAVEVTWKEPEGPREVEVKVHSGPAFVNVERNGTGYQSFREMIRTPEGRAKVMQRALEDLLAIQERYDVIANELGTVRSAIADFGKRVTEQQRRAKAA